MACVFLLPTSHNKMDEMYVFQLCIRDKYFRRCTYSPCIHASLSLHQKPRPRLDTPFLVEKLPWANEGASEAREEEKKEENKAAQRTTEWGVPAYVVSLL